MYVSVSTSYHIYDSAKMVCRHNTLSYDIIITSAKCMVEYTIQHINCMH